GGARSRRASRSAPGKDDSVAKAKGPLAGVRVLDLTRVLAGPFCAMMLGDMGAEVIKVEEPGKGDDTRSWPPFVGGESTYFMSVNRSKKSITLNLKSPDGCEILRKLVKKSDVLLENFRPGTMDKLGFGYKALARLNPRLVYCSVSGFGESGPEAHRAGYDLVIQAESGVMDLTGFSDGPPVKVGNSVGDLVAGTSRARAGPALRHRGQAGAEPSDARPAPERDPRHAGGRRLGQAVRGGRHPGGAHQVGGRGVRERAPEGAGHDRDAAAPPRAQGDGDGRAGSPARDARKGRNGAAADRAAHRHGPPPPRRTRQARDRASARARGSLTRAILDTASRAGASSGASPCAA